MVIQYRANAFVMPDMGAGSNKKGLARLLWISESILQWGTAELTAIDIRHIEHSDECADAVSESFFVAFLPRSLRRLWVCTLFH